jgi:uncharacterized protein
LTLLRSAAGLLVALALAVGALAQPSFPALTGRVVDAANILQPDQRAALEAKLRAHEERTTNQIVVATVPSLGGYEIEEYSNGLYRHWQLGGAQRNTGALLVVAPRERKVRIEVGYGLEGTLTDALSKVIIATAIAPRFRENDFAGGLDAGVDAILATLTGDAAEWQRPTRIREDPRTPVDPVVAFVILLIIFYVISRSMGGRGGPGRPHRRRRGGWIMIPPGGGWGDWSGGRDRGGWGGGFGGGGGGWSGGGSGGFRGGGGSSGGGGASGSW